MAKVMRSEEINIAIALFDKISSVARDELKEKVKMLIVEETNIAHSENQPTSRLTSLFNKVSELK